MHTFPKRNIPNLSLKTPEKYHFRILLHFPQNTGPEGILQFLTLKVFF